MTQELSGPSAALACPHCGEVDKVQHVPAAYESGQGTFNGVVPGGEYGMTRYQGMITSSLASRLDPYPPRRQNAGCFTALGSVFAMAAALFVTIAVAMSFGLASDPMQVASRIFAYLFTWLCPMVTVGITVLFFMLAAKHRRGSVERLPAVLEVWSRAWFCHRCGGVFFPVGTDAGPFVPEGQLMPPQAFRAMLWGIGDYRR